MDKEKKYRAERGYLFMLILGLTGGIACGKSTVSCLLETLGAKVIDADKIVHEVMRPGTNVLDRTLDYIQTKDKKRVISSQVCCLKSLICP